MLVCIRGCGKAGERCLRFLQYKQDVEICFSDIDDNKKICCGKDVYSISESVDKYHREIIHFFIVPLEYSEKIRKDIIEELLIENVKEEHILLFPNRVEMEYKIDKLADIRFIKGFYISSLYFEKLHYYNKERCKRYISDILCKLKETYEKVQYQFIFTGGGYIKDYLDRLKLESFEEEVSTHTATKKVYIICDNSTYNWKNCFEKAGKSDIFIFLYEYLMHYYYKDPNWYFYHCKVQIQQKITSIITGISYIRDALKDKSFLNLANSGQDLEHDFALFKKYINMCEQRNIKIKNVIIGICPYSLRYSMKRSNVNQEKILLYEPVIEGILLKQGYSYYYWWYEYQKRLIDIFLDNFDIQKCFFEHYVPLHEKIDYKETIFDANRLSEEERKANEQNQCILYNKPYGETKQENKEILKEYVVSALSKKLEVYFFIPPYSELHKSTWNRDYLEETKEYLKGLKETYDIHILDMSGDYFPDWYFYDAGHLNTVGQEVVTKKLLEYMAKEKEKYN